MTEVFHKGRWYECPSTWNELSKKQLLKVMAIINSNDSVQVGKIKFFRVLVRWSWWQLVRACGFHRVTDLSKIGKNIPKGMARWLDNTERLAMATEDVTTFIFAKNDLTKNLMPKVKGWYGPESELGNLKMKEVVFCETYFTEWKAHQRSADLDRLCAILYRPGKKGYNKKLNIEGDVRIDFNGNSLDLAEKTVHKWRMPVKLAIASFYEGCRQKKIEENPAVYEGSGEESTTYGLWSVMRTVAKNGTFGTFDHVEETYWDTVLMDLTESVLEYRRHEEQMEEMRAQHAM